MFMISVTLYINQKPKAMKVTSMQTRITVRLDNELTQNLEVLHKWSKVDKAKIVRMIMKDFFSKNEQQLDQYYNEIKSE